LPFEEMLYLWALVSVVALTAMVLVLYGLTRSLRLEGRRIAASPHVRRHLSVLGAMVLLLLAWSYRLDSFDLLLSGSGPDGMFRRVDHRVVLRMDFVLGYGSALAALIVLRAGWVGQLRVAFVTLTVVLVAAVGLRHVVPMVVERSEALGEAAHRDADYVAARGLYSRRAFDVDNIQPAPASAVSSDLFVTAASLPFHASLWDASTLRDGLGVRATSPAGNRGSSTLVEVAEPGWIMARGRVMAVRVERPTSNAEPWRLTLIDVTEPVVRDSVVVMTSDDAAGVWPLVAPGLTDARLLDATADSRVPGATLDSPTTRIAHAWALRDLSLLGADSLLAAPRLVAHRDVRERVQRLAPIFEQGTTVHPVIDGGTLYWTVHLYSATDRYPYSQRWQVGAGVFTYFKLAATAIVDAATGRVRLVPVATPDAMARTWMMRWPSLFTPLSALPASLAARLPPATDAAGLQLRTFARYGSRTEGVVLRHPPDSALVGGPGAPIMLARTTGNVPAWTLPLLDAQEGVAGIATVIGGPERRTYWTAAPAPGAKWPLVLGQLRRAVDSALGLADAERVSVASSGRSRQAAALPAGRMSADTLRVDTARGTASRPRLGKPEAVVTTRGLLYLQTVQGTGADGRFRLRGVAVSDGTEVGVGHTLADAVRALGESVPGTGRVPGAAGLEAPTDRTVPRRWYEAMRAAMKQGDWTAFGAAFDSLGRSLGRPPQ
jgi:hypothetical protein